MPGVITFKCACGQMLRVSEEKAGRQGKCPVCGGGIMVVASGPEAESAPPPPAPPPPPTPSRARPETPAPAPPSIRVSTTRAMATWIGTAILATFFLPWNVFTAGREPDGRTIHVWMSWDLFGLAQRGARPCLVGLWTLGVLAIVLARAFRGRARAIGLAAIGTASVVFVFLGLGYVADLARLLGVAAQGLFPLQGEGAAGMSGGYVSALLGVSPRSVIALLAATILIAGTSLFVRFGDRFPFRLLAGVSGIVLAVVAFTRLVIVLDRVGDLPSGLVPVGVMAVVSALLGIAAGGMSGLNLAAVGVDPRRLAKASWLAACGCAGAAALCVLLGPVGARQWGATLFSLNVVALAGGSFFLFAVGLSRTLAAVLAGEVDLDPARDPTKGRPWLRIARDSVTSPADAPAGAVTAPAITEPTADVASAIRRLEVPGPGPVPGFPAGPFGAPQVPSVPPGPGDVPGGRRTEPGDAVARLRQLRQLLAQGLITEAEYQEKRRRVLDEV